MSRDDRNPPSSRPSTPSYNEPWPGFESLPPRTFNYRTTGAALDAYNNSMISYEKNSTLPTLNTSSAQDTLQQCVAEYMRAEPTNREKISNLFTATLTKVKEDKFDVNHQEILDNLMAHYTKEYNMGGTTDTAKVEGLLQMGETLCEKGNLHGSEQQWMQAQRKWESEHGKEFRYQLQLNKWEREHGVAYRQAHETSQKQTLTGLPKDKAQVVTQKPPALTPSKSPRVLPRGSSLIGKGRL